MAQAKVTIEGTSALMMKKYLEVPNNQEQQG